jgi:hypothetical protein
MRVFTNVAANTYSVGYRIFHPMRGNVEYTRIDGNAVTTLSANLNVSDKVISVTNVSALPEPNPSRAIPGVIFVNGERIHYYRRYDDAKLSTAQTWSANTVFALDTLISYDSNVYLTLGNIYANSSTYLNTANLELIRSNTLAQIRRGVDGTGSPNVHVVGTPVVDSSTSQWIKGDTHNTTWLNMTGNIADGTGLEGSSTESAIFIMAKESYPSIRKFIGMDDPANAAEPEATAWVLMDGPFGDGFGFYGGVSWRKMAPVGTVNGKTSYNYVDETVYWDGTYWLYTNVGLGVVSVGTGGNWPWQATWTGSYTGAKITSTYAKTTNYPAVP